MLPYPPLVMVRFLGTITTEGTQLIIFSKILFPTLTVIFSGLDIFKGTNTCVPLTLILIFFEYVVISMVSFNALENVMERVPFGRIVKLASKGSSFLVFGFSLRL
ncbi:104aa long hypothetical protein [Pyrococcus horikoshii OT3]|uniref:Uncharacterized protein n=1 Tax=Pyrococcus horikoshii (strain ATCC 700860 / DSM 12428 / JCM 9974 / NBRC 100139 / OT-3) TaxID=70601 RepID=O58065_PYRHO|nr:104aa long hypothetical protein [Pyrococcus horikoshii OT3]